MHQKKGPNEAQGGDPKWFNASIGRATVRIIGVSLHHGCDTLPNTDPIGSGDLAASPRRSLLKRNKSTLLPANLMSLYCSTAHVLRFVVVQQRTAFWHTLHSLTPFYLLPPLDIQSPASDEISNRPVLDDVAQSTRRVTLCKNPASQPLLEIGL